jgi:lysophospholipase L1-like esterase
MRINQLPLLLLAATVLMSVISAHAAPAPKTTSFADFDRRAKNGERLTVVFFGASLTWGANASDPIETSYRADTARRFVAAYPKAHFRFYDAAIGGTGSQLGVFRLQRDVLSRKPDLVFLDFSANDDIYSDSPESLASYESLVRRLVRDAKCPVVQVILPFKWNIKAGEMEKMKRRTAHLAIARSYNAAVGDAIALINERVAEGKSTLEELWPFDGVHPGDKGYALFAEAAWQGYQNGVARKLVLRAPAKLLYADTFLSYNRVHLATMGDLPAGWRKGIPNRTSAYYDMLMSRWLDSEVIGSNRLETVGADGKKTKAPQQVERLKLKFRGSFAMLYGEGTTKSGKFQVYLDGKLVEHKVGKDMTTEFNSGRVSVPSNGNTHSVELIAQNLDPNVEHTLEIEPLFEEGKEQELRIESLCVAGGAAQVSF